MILPSLRIFTLGDIVLQGSPTESPGYIFSGRVIVKITVPTSVRQLKVALQSEQGSRWLQLRRKQPRNDPQSVEFSEVLYADSEPESGSVWSKGTYEFYFQLIIPGHLCETMYTEHKRVAYELRATLVAGGAFSGAKRTIVQPVAVKRVPYFGAVWESIANDQVHVTAVWRDKIEMCALGCNRVQRDGEPFRVKGVIRALEKGFRLTRVGFILEERTRSRLPGSAGSVKCTSSIAASKYLKTRVKKGENSGWHGGQIVDQMSFDMELQIPKAYGKIQYDIKHGSVTVSHRLAFVVAVIDKMGHGTSLRLFTPLHIMPCNWVDTGDELPSYISSFSDRVLLRSSIVQQDDSSESSSRNTSEDSLDVLTETATEGSGGSGSSQLSGISPVGADANVGLAETWSWEMVQEQSRGGFMPLEERMQVSARQ